MPLVPGMIQELVWALPPLGGARVLDLLGQYSTVQYSTGARPAGSVQYSTVQYSAAAAVV